MSQAAGLSAAWRLTRPGQWPILSAQFLVSVLLVSPRAMAGGCWLNPAALGVLACSWLVWVVMLNGGTLAFNSAYDRDTGPVAYLPDPPPPPAWLGAASAALMAAGALLGTLVTGSAFGAVVALCVALSVLYSHPAARFKSRPGLDLAVNMAGYGAATTLAGILAGTAAYLGQPPGACGLDGVGAPPFALPALEGSLTGQLGAALADGKGWLIAGFGLLFGSFYPTTQIYQMRDDLDRGDRTLATALGTRPALVLALVLGLGAGAAFLAAWPEEGNAWSRALPTAAVLLWTGHLARWWWRAEKLDRRGQEKGMYTALTLWAVVDAGLLLGWMFRL